MEILSGILFGLLIYFAYKNIKIKKENTFLKLALIEEFASKNIKTPEQTPDSFLKFVSDSREWAFEYIENVQKELRLFIDIADKQFAFFDKFGSLTDQYPNYQAMKIISEEYKKLKELLPEESKND